MLGALDTVIGLLGGRGNIEEGNGCGRTTP